MTDTSAEPEIVYSDVYGEIPKTPDVVTRIRLAKLTSEADWTMIDVRDFVLSLEEYTARGYIIPADAGFDVGAFLQTAALAAIPSEDE